MLLCFCLENAKRSLGRTEQVQRTAAPHYMAAWIDLPESVAHLRFVPEMIVAMLADQEGALVEPNDDSDRTWFAVGRGFEENVLLRAFHKGVLREGELASRTSDRFDESVDVGLDQLLTIRLAQQLARHQTRCVASQAVAIASGEPVARYTASDHSRMLSASR